MKITIGSKLILHSTKDEYEIKEFYYSTDTGYWGGFLVTRNCRTNEEERHPMWMIQELLQDSHLYPPEHQELCEKVLKIRAEREQKV